MTRDRTTDVGKLVAQLHSAPAAAYQAERQAMTARLDLTQIVGYCDAVSTSQNS